MATKTIPEMCITCGFFQIAFFQTLIPELAFIPPNRLGEALKELQEDLPNEL